MFKFLWFGWFWGFLCYGLRVVVTLCSYFAVVCYLGVLLLGELGLSQNLKVLTWLVGCFESFGLVLFWLGVVNVLGGFVLVVVISCVGSNLFLLITLRLLFVLLLLSCLLLLVWLVWFGFICCVCCGGLCLHGWCLLFLFWIWLPFTVGLFSDFDLIYIYFVVAKGLFTWCVLPEVPVVDLLMLSDLVFALPVDCCVVTYFVCLRCDVGFVISNVVLIVDLRVCLVVSSWFDACWLWFGCLVILLVFGVLVFELLVWVVNLICLVLLVITCFDFNSR